MCNKLYFKSVLASYTKTKENIYKSNCILDSVNILYMSFYLIIHNFYNLKIKNKMSSTKKSNTKNTKTQKKTTNNISTSKRIFQTKST